MLTYNSNSAYYRTPQTSWYLSNYVIRPIPSDPLTDRTIVIPPEYHLMPGKMAFDLYQDSRLIWVFTLMNMDTLKDPIYDFKSGTSITICTPDRLRSLLS